MISTKRTYGVVCVVCDANCLPELRHEPLPTHRIDGVCKQCLFSVWEIIWRDKLRTVRKQHLPLSEVCESINVTAEAKEQLMTIMDENVELHEQIKKLNSALKAANRRADQAEKLLREPSKLSADDRFVYPALALMQTQAREYRKRIKKDGKQDATPSDDG